MIELRYSGGVANAAPELSIGGAMSSVVVPSPGRLMPVVTSAVRASGAVWYSCVYVRADATYAAVRAWISSGTLSTATSVSIGWGAAQNATQTAIANNVTAPAGVTFAAPVSYAAAVTGNSYTTGQYRALWIRFTVSAGASVVPLDQFKVTVDAAEPAPMNSVAPAISGLVKQGQTIGLGNGTWTNAVTYARQLQLSSNGSTGWTNISGATGATFVLTSSQVGKYLRLMVTASNVGGTTAAAYSSVSTAVAVDLSPPVNTSTPILTGGTEEGGTLTLDVGTWTGSPTSYARQFQTSSTGSGGWSDIPGATGSTLTTTGRVGNYIRGKVIATNADGPSDPSYSNVTGPIEVVAAPAWVPSDVPGLISWFDMVTPADYNATAKTWSARYGAKQFVSTSGAGPSKITNGFSGNENALVFTGISDTDLKIISPGFAEVVTVFVLNFASVASGVNPSIWSRPGGLGYSGMLAFDFGGLSAIYLANSADWYDMGSYPKSGIAVTRHSKAGRVVRWNGEQKASVTSTSTGTEPGTGDDFNIFPYPGASTNYTIQVAAIGIFTAASWSDALAQKIEGFVAHNNIGVGPDVLPAGHPYKSSAP